MKIEEIRKYGILEATVNEMESAVECLEIKKESAKNANIRESYERQIDNYEHQIAAATSSMIRIDSAILQIECDKDRLILNTYKHGDSIECVAYGLGYSDRTLYRRLAKIKEEIADY